MLMVQSMAEYQIKGSSICGPMLYQMHISSKAQQGTAEHGTALASQEESYPIKQDALVQHAGLLYLHIQIPNLL